MKKKVIVIPAFVILLIILVGVFAVIYFFTDIFKSNKKLFFKYISQNTKIEQILKDDDIKTYEEKQKTTAYKALGNISANITTTDNSQADLVAALQNCNITFEGNVDKANNYAYYTAKANYSDTQSLEFEFVQNNDVYAAKINEVVAKFIGIENNNLKEFATRLGMDETTIQSIPDKIDFNKMQASNLFTNSELEQIKKTYLEAITENLRDDMFSKESINSYEVYKLKINSSDLNKIAISILSKLKDDDMLLGKIKQIMINYANLTSEEVDLYMQELKNEIQSEIDECKSSEIPMNLTIKVYEQSGKLAEIEFIVSDIDFNEQLRFSVIDIENGINLKCEMLEENQTFSISIEKEKTENEIKYILNTYLQESKIFDLTMSFSGIKTEQVQEKATLNLDVDLNDSNISSALGSTSQGMEGSSRIQYISTYTNNKTFGTSIEKVEASIMTVNTAPNAKAIENLFGQITAKLEQVNKAKMKNAGIKTNQNPFIYYAPAIIPISALKVVQSPDIVMAPIGFSSGFIAGLGLVTYSNTQNSISDTELNTQLNDVELQAFNAVWEQYVGRNVSATSVRSLVAAVISNNQSSTHQITVNEEIPTEMPTLDKDKKYAITLSYDSQGYVNGVVYE